ncbi:hypothetical protein EON63_18080 [archaeon]|nr:MAG: hypothetical protein EON63_18080 [archaeon]
MHMTPLTPSLLHYSLYVCIHQQTQTHTHTHTSQERRDVCMGRRMCMCMDRRGEGRLEDAEDLLHVQGL